MKEIQNSAMDTPDKQIEDRICVYMMLAEAMKEYLELRQEREKLPFSKLENLHRDTGMMAQNVCL